MSALSAIEGAWFRGVAAFDGTILILLLNRSQRILFNIALFIAGLIMVHLTNFDEHIKIVESISTILVLSISSVLSHHQYQSWKENIINKKKLNFINNELEVTNSYLNNSKLQLVTSNNNLQDFVYAISHDLREPIRISNNLLEIILIKGKTNFTELEVNLLKEVKTNNNMMNVMLEDLLEYSKIGNHHETSLVNLSAALGKAIGLLKNKIEANHMIINAHNLPSISCAEGELLSLFQNLLNNSIKYKRENINPQVDIQYIAQKNNHKIIYQDNGIGIPANEIENVFNIFYRAKNTKNITGTGIGLSICKKIIENLNGEINITSRENEGIQVTMLLPIK